MLEAVLGKRVAPIREMLLQQGGVLHPDESFFNILAYNPHLEVPGACLNAPSPETERNIGFLAKLVIWGDYDMPCNTKLVRLVCILGSPHITLLQTAPHLFANKFYSDFHPEAMMLWRSGTLRRSRKRLSWDIMIQQVSTLAFTRIVCVPGITSEFHSAEKEWTFQCKYLS